MSCFKWIAFASCVKCHQQSASCSSSRWTTQSSALDCKTSSALHDTISSFLPSQSLWIDDSTRARETCNLRFVSAHEVRGKWDSNCIICHILPHLYVFTTKFRSCSFPRFSCQTTRTKPVALGVRCKWKANRGRQERLHFDVPHLLYTSSIQVVFVQDPWCRHCAAIQQFSTHFSNTDTSGHIRTHLPPSIIFSGSSSKFITCHVYRVYRCPYMAPYGSIAMQIMLPCTRPMHVTTLAQWSLRPGTRQWHQAQLHPRSVAASHVRFLKLFTGCGSITYNKHTVYICYHSIAYSINKCNVWSLSIE